MNRNTSMVIGAIALAAVATAVLVLSGVSNLGGMFGPSTSELLAQLRERASMNGIAYTFADAEAKKWAIAPGHRIERFSVGDAASAVVRLTSTGSIDYKSFDWPNQGLSVTLPHDFAKISNGQQIEVGFIARQSSSNPSDTISVVYATQEAGNSTWRQIKLGGTFEMHKFVYNVPNMPTGYTKDPIVVIHSDFMGQGRSVEILGVYVKLSGS